MPKLRTELKNPTHVIKNVCPLWSLEPSAGTTSVLFLKLDCRAKAVTAKAGFPRLQNDSRHATCMYK